MRIPSGKTDQVIFFVAVDSTDRVTRKTGLSSFTVYRSRNGGTATVYTTPTVTELSSANMPGVYALTVDEDTTVASTSDSEEYCVHITCSGMAPVTRTIELYRRDTTTGNTLDVNAAGEAGLDWANVGSPTTTLNLSGTTVKTATDVETDTQDIQSRLPAALVSGRMDSSVGAMAANVLTASAIAADAITDAKVASDVTIASVTGSVGSVTGAVGSVTGNVGGNVTGSVGSIATGGIAAASFAASAITAASIASDAITAAKVADGTIDAATFAAGAINAAAIASDAITAAKVADGTIDAATFAAGAINAAAIATDAIDADALASDAIAEIQSGLSTLTAAGVRSAVGLASANLDTQLGVIAAYIDTEVAAIKAKTDNLPANPAASSDIPSAASIADAVWEEAIADHSGTVGSTAEALDSASSGGDPAAIASAVWDEDLSGHTTAGTAGKELADAAAGGSDPWATALPGSYGAGTAGKIVGDNLNATVSSRLAPTVAGRTLDVTATGEAGIDWGNIGAPTTTQGLTGTTISSSQVAASVTAAVTVGTNNDKTGYGLSAAAIQAIWDALTSALTTAGSIGKLLLDRIDAAISSRSTYAGADTSGTTTLLSRLTSGRATNLDNLDAAVSTRLATSGYTAPLDASGTRTAVGLASANLDTQLSTIGSAAVSAATDAASLEARLPASPAAVSDIPTAAENADKLLARNLAGGSDGGRIVTDALRTLRNKTSVALDGTVTVMEEDDTTPAWTGTATRASANAIIEIDPA